MTWNVKRFLFQMMWYVFSDTDFVTGLSNDSNDLGIQEKPSTFFFPRKVINFVGNVSVTLQSYGYSSSFQNYGCSSPSFDPFPSEFVQFRYATFGGFLSHRGTPSFHPFLDGIFHQINHAIGGTTMAMETSIPTDQESFFPQAMQVSPQM